MTTSATGERAGFTLLEILLALALIALLATVFIGGSSALLADRQLSPDDQFWKACSDARKKALETERDVTLSFDSRASSFTLSDGATTASVPVVVPSGSDLMVDFLPAQQDATSGALLIGGTLVETGSVRSVTFFPDGTCTPFRVQIRLNGGAHTLAVDPWTCAQILTNAKS